MLHDTSVTISGVKFYGAPWVPELSRHAFYANERALRAAWLKIPADVDVLITHTPPAGVLDVSSRGQSLGCPLLAGRVKALGPRLHCFGHVHASAGVQVQESTTFVNATSVNSALEIANLPFEFEL
ncbi:hypothetical protein AIOL_002456 [Candidatus Rhodobacter oscarellae]|uniref:Phosphoesterase n=1 Tax=Candidatus Rhodobacter oscarellae TaxID=1675527 RepID=A0A0J9E3W2_9RHOB|nr:hypothetical protein AIOL_002456 [Candidatus Rhodobacter lobularis]